MAETITVQGIELRKLYYRVDEVEALFPLSRSKIYDLVRAGTLTAYCPNGAGKKPIFIARVELVEYFASIRIPKEAWNE